MSGLSPATRLALGLATMTVTVLCAAQVAGVLDDPREAELVARQEFGEAVAIAISGRLAGDLDPTRSGRTADRPAEGIGELLEAWASRNEDLNSIAIRSASGQLLASTGPVPGRFVSDAVNAEPVSVAADEIASDPSLIIVPLYDGPSRIGQVEFRFAPIARSWNGIQIPPLVRTFAFIAAAGFITHLLFLRRMLRYLDPSTAVPARVRTTLDTLAEGLVLLDGHSQIVLANAAFAKLLGVPADELIGRKIDTLQWLQDGVALSERQLPWQRAILNDEAVVGVSLQIEVCEGGMRALLAVGEGGQRLSAPVGELRNITFLVNATPIDSEDGSGQRGALVSFDDITTLEQKKLQLAETLDAVRESSEEIQRQNAELERLATHDALTGCVNRRRLFEELEAHWSASERHGYPVSCILTDVDHFKQVNDTYGHSVGDEVLIRVAESLRGAARESDMVARYGGEEFCIVLPHTTLVEARVAAERFRRAVAAIDASGVSVTASFGISAIGHDASDPQELIDQADRCLYEAKHLGRNCVVPVTEIDLEADLPETADDRAPTDAVKNGPSGTRIPFQAVTALISALAYRDQRTASHCRRVADLAVATAEGLLSLSDCYTLEIAALLHDLGKIGVPDQILLKSGPLTDQEWDVMRRHDRIGVEIVRASFACPALTAILSQYRQTWSQGKGEMSVSSRILAIADAYDSMVTDQPYRPGRSRQEAFAELRRCSEEQIGQFDPEIAERFINAVRVNHSGPSLSVAKESALSIGMQIEHLSAALDDQDLDRLAAMASRVRQVATQYGVQPVADQAEQLSRAVDDSEQDLLSVLQSAGNLLTLCRSTQQSYLETDAVETDAVETDAVETASARPKPYATEQAVRETQTEPLDYERGSQTPLVETVLSTGHA